MEQKILQLLTEQGEKLKQIETRMLTSKKVFNLDDLCAYTGLSKSHIYKLTSNSGIPHFKKAKHLFFDKEEIENWLKECRHKSVDELEQGATSYILQGKVLVVN